MKILANLLLLLFITFLSTPTVVSVIEKNCDTSIFYTMSEEETHKEIKVVFQGGHQYSLNEMLFRSSGPIFTDNQLTHDNISRSIFIPPPEQV